VKELIGGLRTIAPTAQIADFIFYLHHQYCLLIPIFLPDVLHELGEGMGVALEGLRA